MNRLIRVIIGAIIGASVVCCLFSCENEQDVKNDLQRLKNERSSLKTEIDHLNIQKEQSQNEIAELTEKLKELNILKSGRTPQYILTFSLIQEHPFDIEKQIKDAFNEVKFELPVDKDFYHEVKIGQRIVDEFREGSFILEGSVGNSVMKIINKEIR